MLEHFTAEHTFEGRVLLHKGNIPRKLLHTKDDMIVLIYSEDKIMELLICDYTGLRKRHAVAQLVEALRYKP
jgi:hypothetical protein